MNLSRDFRGVGGCDRGLEKLVRLFHASRGAPYTPRRCAPPLFIEGTSNKRGRSPLYEEGCPIGRGVLDRRGYEMVGLEPPTLL